MSSWSDSVLYCASFAGLKELSGCNDFRGGGGTGCPQTSVNESKSVSQFILAPSVPAHPARMSRRLLEHPVGLEEEDGRNRDPEGLGGLQVDDQLEFYRLLHGQVGGLDAFEDLIHKGGGATKALPQARPIRHETTSLRKLPAWKGRWQPVPDREVRDLGAVRQEHRAAQYYERPDVLLGHSGEGPVELLRPLYLERLQLYP